MGIGEICALASAVVWAIAVIMYTRIGDRLPAFDLNLVKNSIGVVLLAITAGIFEGYTPPNLNSEQWSIVVISGVIGVAVADTLYMKALNYMGAGSTGVVAALYSPFVVILSVFYLDETFSLGQTIGLLLVLGGVLLISLDKPVGKITQRHKLLGIACGASSVFLTALGVVIIKPVIEQQPFFWMSGLRLLVGLLGMMLLLSMRREWSALITRLGQPHNWTAIVISSILGAYLATSLWLAGFKYTDASIAGVLNETNSVFIVLLAWLILKEPITRNKFIGTAIAVTGVILVVFA